MLYQAVCIVSLQSVNPNWNGITVQKCHIPAKIGNFFVLRDHEIWWMTLKSTGHHFYATSGFVHHCLAISQFKLELQSGNAQFGSKSVIFVPCDLEI